MGKRGPKPKGKVKIKWSGDFAYAIGLIATDGCLSKSGRHVVLTSKDKEQLDNFLKCLKIKSSIGKTLSGYNKKPYSRAQIGDVLFYEFLKTIGLTQAKSKTMGEIDIPKEYFFDFLRGVLDGDGYTYSYWDTRWRSSFMFYLGFVSASRRFIDWLQKVVFELVLVKGHVTFSKTKGACYQLKYAKNDALKILRKMYSLENSVYLSRKKLKIDKMLAIVGESL